MIKRVSTKSKPVSLTAVDLAVENFLKSHAVREGFSPSHREIARALDRQLSSVQNSLAKLVRHGRIEPIGGKRRGLTPITPVTQTITIPLLGSVAAGQPIEAIEASESVEVPPWMLKPNTRYFVLRVRGRSMIDDHIDDGDLVLIRAAEVARNGERVVALINNEATLKRFESRGGRVFLHPANAAMTTIEVGAHQELRIAGILAGVLRKADG